MTEPESSVIRKTVDDVLRNNTWAVRIEIALIAISALAVIVSAVFVTINTQRINDLLERGDAQRKALTDLTTVIQTYNEEHAKQAETSFRALNESQRCAVLGIFTGTALEKVTAEEIAACYQPIVPAPPPPTTTTTSTTRR